MNLSIEEAQQLCNANELDPVNLVDPDMVADNVLAILKYMDNDQLLELRRKNFPVFERHMEEKFPKFSEDFYFIFKKVIGGDNDGDKGDLGPLFAMLKQIKMIKQQKQSFKDAEDNVVDGLRRKYVKKSGK